MSQTCPTCGIEAVAAVERQPWGLHVHHLVEACAHPELGAAIGESACDPPAAVERGRWRRLLGGRPSG